MSVPAEYAQAHVRLGYASTAHGVQGETVDISYTLVSRATTHRSLYVGATRGREANHLAVITETTDLDDARDTLEWVLTNDRVDVPAIARRRELAEREPPQMSAQERLDAAQAAFFKAKTRSAPAREVLDEAHEELTAAESNVSGLKAELRAARPWERRAVRRDLAGAENRVADARSRYEDARDQARPSLEEVEQARQRLDVERAETEVELMHQRFEAFGREAPSRAGLSR